MRHRARIIANARLLKQGREDPYQIADDPLVQPQLCSVGKYLARLRLGLKKAVPYLIDNGRGMDKHSVLEMMDEAAVIEIYRAYDSRRAVRNESLLVDKAGEYSCVSSPP